MGLLWSFGKNETGQEMKRDSLCVNIKNHSLCHNLDTCATGEDDSFIDVIAASHKPPKGGVNFDSYRLLDGFGGLGVACWPLVPEFAGSNPAKAVGFLGRKNPQHAFLRRGSKAVGPMS